MPRLLIPAGLWKVEAEPTNESQHAIRLSGQAFVDTSPYEECLHRVLLTPDQAHELVSALNSALRELELRHRADLERVVEGAGIACAFSDLQSEDS